MNQPHSPDRILAFVGKNDPGSRAEYEKFPPSDFPIRFTLRFSRRDAHLVEGLKQVLDGQPLGHSRYKVSVAKHVGGSVTLRCYFKHVDALRPVAWQLEGKNLWNDVILHEEALTPRALIEKAKSLSAKEMACAL